MQNQPKKARKLKPYSRWSYNTSSSFTSPYYTEDRDCSTPPIFSENIYAR